MLSAMFSFGAFLQPLMLRTALGKMRIIGTLSVSLLMMNVFKLAGYAAFGFNFGPYLLVIAACILAGIPGGKVGRHLGELSM